MGSRRIKSVLICTTATGTAALLLGFFAFAAVATRTEGAQPLAADGIVVLTGGEARIAEAGRLLGSGKARRLLVSGVNRRTSRDDLRRLMNVETRLFDCCVDVGYEALDTFGNADEARLWASQWQFSRLIVVTASYHMPRSLAEMALALPGAKLQGYSVVPRKLQLEGSPWWLRSTAARALLWEFVKFVPVATRLAIARVAGLFEVEALDGTARGINGHPHSPTRTTRL